MTDKLRCAWTDEEMLTLIDMWGKIRTVRVKKNFTYRCVETASQRYNG